MNLPYNWKSVFGYFDMGLIALLVTISLCIPSVDGETSCGMRGLQPDFAEANAKLPCAQGTYTIGGSNPDFVTIDSAVSYIEANGVCGPVVFNIRSGTYTEYISFESIQGTSPTNTIVFQSATGNKADVTIRHTAIDTADNYVIRLNGASYVTFQHLTMRALGNDFGRVIVVRGTSHHCLFIDNTLTSADRIHVSTSNAIIYSDGRDNDGFEFRDNLIDGGTYGIYWYGLGPTYPERGTIIMNNVIESWNKGIELYYQVNARIQGNIITSNTFAQNLASTGIQGFYLSGRTEIISNTIDIQTGSRGLYLANLNGGTMQPIRIANNFIHVGPSNPHAIATGIYLSGSLNSVEVVYNSVNITTSATGGESSKGMLFGASSIQPANDVIIYNNIFSNSGLGNAAAFYDLGGVSSDYNNYYAGTGGALIYGYNGLSSFQNATGQDLHSIAINPQFASNTDLHSEAKGLDGKAVPINWVMDDIDGDVRDVNTPDIGADEFTPQDSIDIAILNIISPPEINCGLSSAENIEVVLLNYGIFPLGAGETMDVSYRINMGPTNIETITLSQMIFPSDSFYYTFSKTADFSSAATQYGITAWIDKTGDKESGNDTLNKSFFNQLGSGYPIQERFEGWTISNPGMGSCLGNASQGGAVANGWQQDKKDDGAWRVGSGATPTSGTGPSRDFNTGTSTGKYLYAESTSPCDSFTIGIISPCMDMSQVSDAGMNLAFHMHGSTVGSLFVDVLMEDGTTYDGIWKVVGEGGNEWGLAAIDLKQYATQGAFRVRLRAHTASGKGDIAIDDIRFGTLPSAVISKDTVRGCGFVKVWAEDDNHASYTWSTGVTGRVVQISNTDSAVLTKVVAVKVDKGGLYNLDTVFIVLDPGPVLQLGENLLYCDTSSIVLDAANPGFSHLWDNGATTQIREIVESGQYWVEVDDGRGCIKRDTVHVLIESEPVANFTFQRLNEPFLVLFTSIDSIGSNHKWDFGDGNTSTRSDLTHFFTEPGAYTVTLIVSNGCGSDTIMRTVDVNTGVGYLNEAGNVKIYPNPAVDIVRLDIESEQPEAWKIRILTIEGVTVKAISLPYGMNSCEVPLSNIPSGYYLVEFSSEVGRIVKPLIVK